MSEVCRTDIREIRERLTIDLGTLIRPELEAEGLAGPYILLAGIDPGVTLGEDIGGATCPSMGEIYHDSIEGYEGPGPAMILNPAVPIDMVATAAHELSHRLLAPTLCKDPPSQAYVVAARQCIEQAEWEDFSPEAATLEEELVAARKAHGLDFIRMAIHVSARLCEMRWPLNTTELLFWQEVTSTPSFEFFDALRDECHELRDEPLSAIKSIPPPTGFNSLFESPENYRPF